MEIFSTVLKDFSTWIFPGSRLRSYLRIEMESRIRLERVAEEYVCPFCFKAPPSPLAARQPQLTPILFSLNFEFCPASRFPFQTRPALLQEEQRKGTWYSPSQKQINFWQLKTPKVPSLGAHYTSVFLSYNFSLKPTIYFLHAICEVNS